MLFRTLSLVNIWTAFDCFFATNYVMEVIIQVCMAVYLCFNPVGHVLRTCIMYPLVYGWLSALFLGVVLDFNEI